VSQIREHLIIGGSEFLGSHILQALRKRSTPSVVSLDVARPSGEIEGVEYIDGDITDEAGLIKVLAQVSLIT
jgi:nucleoside-diphosphate-sugar epimerase